MGVVRLDDELQRVIEGQVAQGRAASPAAFVEEAVLRLVEATSAEEDAVRQAVAAGSDDIAAGRYITVTSEADRQLVQARLLERLQSRLAADE